MDLFTETANENFKKHIRTQSKKTLEIIDSSINWKRHLKPIEEKIDRNKNRKLTAGRKSFPIETIVKCFLLQVIYDLSDPRLEEEIADRRSFQIFLGFSIGDSIPDETTIVRYRKEFAELGLDKMLFKNFNKELKRLNLIVGKGTIVDATIKQAQATNRSNRDTDAKFTKKRGKTYYGYKGHIAMDEGSEIIIEVEFTDASIHDSALFDSLVDLSEEAIFADKGYANKSRKQRLENKGIFDGILEKGYRNKPLRKSQIRLNKILSTVRNALERLFAFMKRVLGYQRCSYYDLKRNRFEFIFASLVYNIRRMITLTA